MSRPIINQRKLLFPYAKICHRICHLIFEKLNGIFNFPIFFSSNGAIPISLECPIPHITSLSRNGITAPIEVGCNAFCLSCKSVRRVFGQHRWLLFVQCDFRIANQWEKNRNRVTYAPGLNAMRYILTYAIIKRLPMLIDYLCFCQLGVIVASDILVSASNVAAAYLATILIFCFLARKQLLNAPQIVQ